MKTLFLKRFFAFFLVCTLAAGWIPAPAQAAEGAAEATEADSAPEGPAVLTADTAYALLYNGNTLVFQSTDTPDDAYGTLTNTYTFDPAQRYAYASRPWFGVVNDITRVVFADPLRPVYTSYWFCMCSNLARIENIQNLDTSRTIDMEGMFINCSALTELDVSGFDTSNVTTMRWMFQSCLQVPRLDVSGFDTSNVTDMYAMFVGCSALTELDVTHFDTSNVTNINGMFTDCSSLTELDVSSFDTSNVTNMGIIFRGCTGLTELDLSAWNTARVTVTERMFAGCTALEKIYVSDAFVMDAVTDSADMFTDSAALIGGNGTAYSADHTDAEYARIDSASAPGYFTRAGAAPVTPTATSTPTPTAQSDTAYALLYNGNTLVFQSTATPDTSRGNVTNTYEVDLTGSYERDNANDAATTPWYSQRVSITTVDFVDTIAPISTSYWFHNCYNLTQISNLDRLDTSNVTDMDSMFNNCSSLTELDVSGFDTSNVTSMGYMFWGCSGLTELNVSSFDTSNVTDMDSMFNGCSRLTELDVSGFDISNVTVMFAMFDGCSRLTELDVSRFDTSKVTNMAYMFFDCSSLTELDVSGFDTSNVTSMYEMFWNCSSLTTIYASDKFVTDAVTSSDRMFTNCTSLVGGNGTAYSADHVDAEYARIDSESAPGYFTYRAAPSVTPAATATPSVSATPSASVTPSVTVTPSITVTPTNTPTPAATSTPTPIPATATPTPDANGVYAILYDDGTMVFQRGNTPENGRTVRETFLVNMSVVYDGDTDSTYSQIPWYGELQFIQRVVFADSIQPDSTVCWFDGCMNLTTVENLGNLDTSSVTNMVGMFKNCSSLTVLDLSSFDTGNVGMNNPIGCMGSMFAHCSALTELDLSSFNTAHVQSMYRMFYDCINLSRIYVSDNFVTGQLSSSTIGDPVGGMFGNCTSLIGGNGTAYSAYHTDAEYARIDSESAPGYFTAAGAAPVTPSVTPTPTPTNTPTPAATATPTPIPTNTPTPPADDILDPLPLVMTEYRDQVWRLNRNLSTFTKLSIDGVELLPGVDYTVEEGSTKINIPAQTFLRFGEGAHTITGDFTSGPVSQSYTVELANEYRLESNLPNGAMEEGVKYVPYSGYLIVLDREGSMVSDAKLEIVNPPENLGLRMYGENELPDAGDRYYFAGTPLATGDFTFTVAVMLDGAYVASRQFTIHVKDNTDNELENESNPAYAFDDIPDIPVTELNQSHTFYTAGSAEELWKVYLDGRELIHLIEYTFEAVGEDETVLNAFLQLLARLFAGSGTRIVLAEQTMANLKPGQHTISADFVKQRTDGTTEKETAAKSFYVGARPTPTPVIISGGGGGGGGGGRSRTRTTSTASTYQINITQPANGLLKTSHTSAASGTTVTVTATPNSGYQLSSIRVTGTTVAGDVTVNGTGNERTFVMPSKQVTVSAVFERITYQIHTTVTEHGSFTVSHTQASPGTNITIDTRPETGYIVESVRVAGTNVAGDTPVRGSDNRYTFTMPGKQVTISVKFRLFRLAAFEDIDGNHTFFQDAVWAYENGLMNGVTEKYFEPDSLISYITVVVTIARLSKVDLSGYEGMSGAVLGIPDDAWYLKEALWARDIGLFSSGDNLDALFDSGTQVDRSPIPRGTFAIMLRNYLDFQGVETEVPVEERTGFADADRMSSVEEDHAFQTLYKAGIFRGGAGSEQLRMYPTANTSRGNLAALLHRVSDYVTDFRQNPNI